jgi:hypothetical protein
MNYTSAFAGAAINMKKRFYKDCPYCDYPIDYDKLDYQTDPEIMELWPYLYCCESCGWSVGFREENIPSRIKLRLAARKPMPRRFNIS